MKHNKILSVKQMVYNRKYSILRGSINQQRPALAGVHSALDTVKEVVKVVEMELNMEVIMIPKIRYGKTCRQIYSYIQCKIFGKFRQLLQTFGNIWLLLPTDDNLKKLVPKFGNVCKHTATFAFFFCQLLQFVKSSGQWRLL